MKIVIFHCYVSLPEGILLVSKHVQKHGFCFRLCGKKPSIDGLRAGLRLEMNDMNFLGILKPTRQAILEQPRRVFVFFRSSKFLVIDGETL